MQNKGKQMVNIVKNKGGRPPGSGHGQQIVTRIRKEILGAFDIVKRKNRPIDVLLAEQLEKDAAQTLSKLSSFLPKDVNITGGGSEFSLALSEVAERIAENSQLLRDASLEEANDMKQVIDITAENVEEAEIVPGIVPKSGKKS
jgi:hypothetical protein